jgi:trehalose-phosphatase
MLNHTSAPPLIDRLLTAAAQNVPVQIYFDGDGTVSPFVLNPKDARMDPDCFSGLVRLSALFKTTATAITGRDVREARDLLFAPAYDVQNSAGKVLASAAHPTLQFAIIGSHGVERMERDGNITRHDLGAAAAAFITAAQHDAMKLQKLYAGLHVENKYSAVSINAASVADNLRQQATRAARTLLESYAQAHNHPRDHGHKIFAIREEGAQEVELRPALYGKDFGIKRFGDADPKALTLFCCDSLGVHGTDRNAAALINDKQHFADGHVVMVQNGRTIVPPPEAPHHPAMVFAAPKELGRFLNGVARLIEKIRPT